MTIQKVDKDKIFPYGSVEEADRRVVEKLNERKATFCPISNETCRLDCVCYVIPEINNLGSTEMPIWDCRGGYCSCYMLVGLV